LPATVWKVDDKLLSTLVSAVTMPIEISVAIRPNSIATTGSGAVFETPALVAWTRSAGRNVRAHHRRPIGYHRAAL